MADSTRQLKVARLLQKELAEWFRQNPIEGVGNKLISVTQVRISPDLSVARVYLSIFPTKDNAINIKTINTFSKEIKHRLSTQLRYQIRVIPQMSFFLDDSLDYIENIDQLLKN